MAALVQTPITNNFGQLGMGGLGTVTLDNPYEPWFGPISNQALQDLSNSVGRAQTIRNLPEYYKGRNVRLLSFIEEQIFFNDQYLSQVILPIEETDEMNWEWNIWKFNHHLLQPVPFQGVSRFITSETAQGRKSTTRFGIAFTLEHGFMNTEAGRTNYYYNLRSIAGSVNETHNFEILRALISAPQESENFALQKSFYHQKTFQDIMDLEKDMWALLQKDADGFKKMDTETIERMKFNQGDADTWLIPPKMQYYLQLVPRENTEYRIAGDVGPKRRANNYSYDSPNAFQEFGQARVYFVRQFNYDHHQNVDAMARYRQIGEFNKLLPTGSTDPMFYSKKERDIVVYNEDKDDWHKFTLHDAIENCMMFKQHSDNGLSLLEHPTFTMLEKEYKANPFFMESSNRGSMLDGDDNTDGSQSHWRPIEIFGQMAEKHFSSNTQTLMAQTILKKVSSILDNKVEGQIEQLMNTFEKLNDQTWSNRADLIGWFNDITNRGAGADNVATLRGKVTTVNTLSERLHRFSAFPALKYDVTSGHTETHLPPRRGIGLTNWYGLDYLIRNPVRDVIGPVETYTSARNTLRTLVRQLGRILPGCLLIDKSRTPGHYPVQSQEVVFMENALGIGGFPVWLNVAANDAALIEGPDSRTTTARRVGDNTITSAAAQAGSLAGIGGISSGVQIIAEIRAKLISLFPGDNTVRDAFDESVQLAVPVPIGAAAHRTQPVAPGAIDKETMRLSGSLFQMVRPLAPYTPSNPNSISFESLQRFLNFVDILRCLNFTTIKQHTGAKKNIIQLLRDLTVIIESKINKQPEARLGNLNINELRSAVATSGYTSEIDVGIREWVTKYAAHGWFDFGGDQEDMLNLLLQTHQSKMRIAVSDKDRRYYALGIYPRFGIIGDLTDGDIRDKSFAQLVDKLRTTSTGATEARADRDYFALGGKFGEDGGDDEPLTTLAATSWVRTTLSLSPAQVAKLFQIQYQDKGRMPFHLVTVSFPDSPEAPATPSELGSFFDTYQRSKTGDLGSLPKNALTGLLMDPNQRLQYIELMEIYNGKSFSAPDDEDEPSFRGGRKLKRKRNDLLDLALDGDDDGNMGALFSNKRRKTGERGTFGAIGGPLSGTRSTSSGVLSTDSSQQTNLNVPLLTDHLTDHWTETNKLGQTNIIKAIIRAVLMTPFSKQALLHLNENDCVVPVGFYVFAPHMTYLTLLAIKVMAGERTGRLKVGHRDFEIGNNPKTKVFFGHFTVMSAAIITHPQNVFVAYDVFVKGCFGGAGVRFWNATNAHQYNPEEDETTEADRFSIMISYEEDQLPESRNPLDASGYFSYLDTPGLVDGHEVAKPHYSTAGYYNNLWKYRTPDSFRLHNVSALPLHHPWHEKSQFRQWNHNTVMWLGPQAYYNPQSKKYDLLRQGTGHWGSNGYGPGARAVRNGDLKPFKRFDEIIQTIYIR